MPRRDDFIGDEEEAMDDEDVEEEYGGGRKRRRNSFIDDVAEEDEDEEEEEDDDDDDDEDYGGSRKRPKKKSSATNFFDLEAIVDSDNEEEEEEIEDGFIDNRGADLPDEGQGRMHRHPLPLREDEQEDVEALEKKIQERYARSAQAEYDEEATDVELQALLPSVRDPKLWMVKCAIGKEREVAVCIMQ